jgi:PAS domain-containing protein
MNLRNWINLWLRRPLWLCLLGLLGIVLFLGFVGYLCVPMVKAKIRDSRMHENLKEARAEVGRGDFQGARTAALAVLLAGHQNAEATRILLDAMYRLRDPRLVEVAMLVLVSADQSRDDRLKAWEICCREAAMGVVMQGAQALPEELRTHSDFRLPLADRLIAEELFPDALKAIGIEADVDDKPLSLEWEKRLVRMLVSTRTADGARLAQERVANRLNSNPQEGAVLVPLTDEIPMWQLISKFHEALVASGPAAASEAPEARLRRLRAEAAVWLTRKDELLEELLSDPEADTVLLARWALRAERPDRAAGLVSLEMAAADVSAFLLRVEALRLSEQWDLCRATLEAAPQGVVEAEVQTELAVISAQLGDRTAVNHAVEEAIIVARLASETESMVRLAKFAETRGVADIARRAWVEAAKRRVGPLPLYSRLLPMLQEFESEQREEDLGIIVMAYRRLEPNNPLVMVHHHYVALLRGVLTPTLATTNLAPVVAKSPEFQPARMTLVLAGLLANSPPAELIATLDAGKIDWSTASNSDRAIRALALAANGQHSDADALFATIRWEQLLPSERAVFQGLRRQLAPPGAEIDIEPFMPKPAPPAEEAPPVESTPLSDR